MRAATRWFLVRLIFDPENGGDTILLNVGSHTVFTALHLRTWQYDMLVLSLMI
jgi:hypothetical protein